MKDYYYADANGEIQSPLTFSSLLPGLILLLFLGPVAFAPRCPLRALLVAWRRRRASLLSNSLSHALNVTDLGGEESEGKDCCGLV
jgi:hypothetical protein